MLTILTAPGVCDATVAAAFFWSTENTVPDSNTDPPNARTLTNFMGTVPAFDIAAYAAKAMGDRRSYSRTVGEDDFGSTTGLASVPDPESAASCEPISHELIVRRFVGVPLW